MAWELQFIYLSFVSTPSQSLVVFLWLNTTACCICERALNWIIFFLGWFSSLAGSEHSWKSWKGSGYPLFMGPVLRRELFKDLFLFRHQEKTEQPSFIQFVTERRAIVAAPQRWCLHKFSGKETVRSAIICVPVIRLNYSNRPDREHRRPQCFACALFVARTFKSLNKWQVQQLPIYLCNLVGALPVTVTGLCNALMEMLLSVFVWRELWKGWK